MDPGVRDPAGVRQSVCAWNHAQSRARILAASDATTARDLERLGTRAVSLGFRRRSRRYGLLEHQPHRHRIAEFRADAVSTVVVYVHGLWQSGSESILLRRRLARDLDADAVAFSYPSVAANAGANARALAEYLCAIRADTLHLVGHSLGGTVILKSFEESGEMEALLPPGRIVLMGSPLRGSRTARNLARLPFGKKIMGLTVGQELMVARERRWERARELGVIAGEFGIGLGRLVGTLGGPSDGTVLLEETAIEGAADRLVLRVSHTGMLFSAAVAHAAGAFLRTGRFDR